MSDLELIKITKEGVDARNLYTYLEFKGTRFRDWITSHIKNYGFIEGQDFSVFFRKSKGGRKAKEYALSIDMAKELSMVAKTKRGRDARKHFIECEDILRKHSIKRIVGIEIRKSLTDKIKDSGENERMHGFAYSSYTKLAYKLANIEYKKTKDFRNTLSTKELERLENIESLMKPLIAMGIEYGDIKDNLSALISFKEIKE